MHHPAPTLLLLLMATSCEAESEAAGGADAGFTANAMARVELTAFQKCQAIADAAIAADIACGFGPCDDDCQTQFADTCRCALVIADTDYLRCVDELETGECGAEPVSCRGIIEQKAECRESESEPATDASEEVRPDDDAIALANSSCDVRVRDVSDTATQVARLSDGTYVFCELPLRGLIWQPKVPPDPYTYPQAVTYCKELTLTGRSWRLPTEDELLAITSTDFSGAPVYGDIPGQPKATFWSSTPSESSGGDFVTVDFDGTAFAGIAGQASDPRNAWRVRCASTQGSGKR